jgi:hypothetical protein
MSGFLSNLIARSFTDAPVIQPRVPSLFETSSDEFPGEPQSSTPPGVAPETTAPTNVSQSVSRSSPIGEIATTNSIANASDTRETGSLLKPSERVTEHAPVIAEAPQPRSQTVEVKKLKLETNKVTVPAESFVDAKKDAGRKTPASQALSKPRVVNVERRKDFSPAEQRSSTSAPIIRVTIGRVEVRAIHPPAPAPKPQKPAAPKLSLEDYLQEREKGSR